MAVTYKDIDCKVIQLRGGIVFAWSLQERLKTGNVTFDQPN